MSDDEDGRLEKIEKAVARIERALIGDQEFGQSGLIRRVGAVEGKVKNHDRKLLVWGGTIAGVVATVEVLSWFLHR